MHTGSVVVIKCEKTRKFLSTQQPHVIAKREGQIALVKIGEKTYHRYELCNQAQLKGFRSRKSDRDLGQEYKKNLQDQITKIKTEKISECVQRMENAPQELHEKYQDKHTRSNHQALGLQRTTCTSIWEMLE